MVVTKPVGSALMSDRVVRFAFSIKYARARNDKLRRVCTPRGVPRARSDSLISPMADATADHPRRDGPNPVALRYFDHPPTRSRWTFRFAFCGAVLGAAAMALEIMQLASRSQPSTALSRAATSFTLQSPTTFASQPPADDASPPPPPPILLPRRGRTKHSPLILQNGRRRQAEYKMIRWWRMPRCPRQTPRRIHRPLAPPPPPQPLTPPPPPPPPCITSSSPQPPPPLPLESPPPPPPAAAEEEFDATDADAAAASTPPVQQQQQPKRPSPTTTARTTTTTPAPLERPNLLLMVADDADVADIGLLRQPQAPPSSRRSRPISTALAAVASFSPALTRPLRFARRLALPSSPASDRSARTRQPRCVKPPPQPR